MKIDDILLKSWMVLLIQPEDINKPNIPIIIGTFYGILYRVIK